MRAIIGTCGLCGGPVEAGQWNKAGRFMPAHMYPGAKCLKCGAGAKDYGPTIPMDERREAKR